MNLLPWPEESLAAAASPAVDSLLRRSVAAHRQGLLPQTLLLLGHPGLGREGLAVELAAALICRTGAAPGCECHACSRVRRGVHPDLALLDVEPGHSEIRIRQVQDLTDGIAQVPYEGARRVVIVSSCHTPPLNWEAASALLKVLEEPPPHVTFLLLAANPRRVIATIVSRAVQLRLPVPEPPAAIDALARLHAIPPEDATRLLEGLGGDVAAALAMKGDDLASAVELGANLVPAALAGDPLAFLRLAQIAAGGAGRVGMVASLILAAIGTGVPDCETALEAAATLLRVEHQGAVLHLPADALVASTFAARCGRPGAPGVTADF